MIKVFYWSPFFSNVATIKNVINSAYSLKKFNSNYNISLIDTIGEWQSYERELCKKGIDILNINNRVNLSNYFPIEGFIKTRLLAIYIFFYFFFKLKKLILEKKPNYIIINLLTSLPLFLLTFFNLNTKVILRISGLPKLSLLRKILWKMASKKITFVTCPSEETRKIILNSKIFPKSKVKLLYDPVLVLNDIINKKKINNINFNNYFLNIGRLTRQKNQKLIMESFKDQLFKERLLILGEGEKKNEFLKFIKKNSLETNVILLGYQDDVISYLKKAKAVIVSSLWEDPGAVMIEAAFSNCSIISSDCMSGPKEFLNNNSGGYLFKNNSKEDLLNKINIFLKDNEKTILQKKIYAKKKSKKYTLFYHYKVLNNLLSF